MNSSGIKRGLATTAVSALAIAGLPLFASPASAAHGNAEVTLISQFTSQASVRPDGQNSTVRLEAQVTDPANPVTFQYNTGNPNTWVNIATVSANDSGYVAYEWDASFLVGATNISLRAQVTEGGVEYNSARNGISVTGGAIAGESVNITDGVNKGVFQEPYTETAGTKQLVAVNGTTSATGGSVNVAWYLDVTNDPANQGTVDNGQVAVPVTTANAQATTGQFSGVLDIFGYNYTANENEIAIVASRDSDDVEGFTLYQQVIDAVTVDRTSATVAGSGTAPIVVTVLDQNQAPIAGAEVRSSDQTVIGYTNARGQVTANQTGGTDYYYANATDSNPFEAGLGDKRSADVTVGQYNPTATALEADSSNGAAFDINEYDADDITVQVVDQQGEDFDGIQTVEYYQVFTPFNGDPAVRTPATGTSTTVTAADGTADIPLTLSGSGTYEVFAGVRANPLTGTGAVATTRVITVKAGQADIKFDAAEESAPAGTKNEITGKLVLEDGTGLPGRPLSLVYTPDAGGNAAFDQPTGADSTTRAVTTAADGSFVAVLDDPAVTTGSQPTETGSITASTVDYQDQEGDTDNANDSSDVDVVFSQATPPAGSTVVIGGAIAANGQLGKPGVAVAGNVTVTQPDGNDAGTDRDPVANQLVTLTVDGDSFFTDGTADPAAAIGNETGELRSLGQSITVTTNAAGVANFQVAIEGSDEFDNDGLAEDIVTAAAASVTDTEDVDYSSADPLNGGEVLIDFAADRFQQSGIVPLAPTTDTVAYDVQVTDQFGNPVGGETVAITVDGGSVDNPSITTDFDENVEFSVSSNSERDVTPTGTWTAPTSVYRADNTNDTDTANPGVQGDADTALDVVVGTAPITGDGPAAEFYEVDFAASDFSLTQQGAERVPVGTTVIMEYTAIDQNGEPIEFLVDFFRTGPDDLQGGEANSQNVATGEDGKAQYVFSGTKAGTATVTAIGSVGNDVVPDSQATDTVEFGDTDVPPRAVTALIAGDDNGARKDVVRFQVDDEAEGATVRLFKIKGKRDNRRLQEIRSDIVPAGGELTFKIADRNGNRVTRFIAKVSATDATLKAKSNTQKIR